MPLQVMRGYLGIHLDAPELRRLRDAYLEAFSDLAPHRDLVASLELACQLGKVTRACSMLRLATQPRSPRLDGVGHALLCLRLPLDDSYLEAA